MKTNHFFFFVTLICLLCVNGCTDNTVSLDEKDFGTEIERRKDLTFTFDAAIVPDSLVSRSSDMPYITFEPAMSGTFTWLSRDRIMFSPSRPWSPATQYKAILNDFLVKDDKKRRKLDDDRIVNFRTPLLKFGKASIFWTRNTAQNSFPELRVSIPLSEGVDSEELIQKLSVKIDGNQVKTVMSNLGSTNELSISIVDPGTDNEKKKIEITALAGINVIGGNIPTSNDIIIESEVPEIQSIRIMDVAAENDGIGTYIKVNTSQTPSVPDLSAIVSVNPDASIKMETTEQGFIIRGDFFAGESYKLFVSGALRGVLGGDMGSNFEQSITFGEMEEKIAFTSSKGMYLTSRGEKKIALTISAIPEVVITIAKVFDNNIMHFIREGRGWRDYESGEEWNNYADMDINNFGRIIEEKRVKTSSLPKKGNVKLLDLHFDDRTLAKGIYLVKVSSADDRWQSAAKIISISDVGLIAKHSDNEVVVFANSIYNTDPLQSVELSLISKNNQVLAMGKTDANGVHVFSNIESKYPGEEIAMITSRNGDDYSIMHLSQTKTETSRFEIGGIMENKTGYQAFLYGDRNIYRPGESIYLSGILRDKKWGSVINVPVKLKLLLPNGTEFKSMKFMTDEQGTFETEIKLPEGIVTGTYSAELLSGNDVLLTSNYISVEEFMPDRISVTITGDKEQAKPGDEITVNVKAMNLFGPPAANRTVHSEFSISPVDFSAKGYSDFTFKMNNDETRDIPKQRTEGKTDNEGNMSHNIKIPAEYNDLGLLRGRFYTTVFDETGRPVNRAKDIEIWTQSVFFGIKNTDDYVGTNTKMIFPIVALSKNKQLINSEAEIKIIKYNWHNVIEKVYSNYRVVSQKQEQIVKEQTVSISNQYSYSFIPTVSGEYEIRVYRKGVSKYVSEKFYAYGWGNTQSTSFEVSKEGTIDIETDKESYTVGEKASVLCKTPFAGKLLVCIERDKVHDYFTVQTDKKSGSFTIPIKEEYLPNVYISVTLIKPVDDGALPLTVAYGYQSLKVTKKQNNIPVVIEAPESSRGNKKQTITVKTGVPNSKVTIAIVDEGILQLKNYSTPAPFDFFYAQRALQVDNYNIYPLLFPEFSRLYSSIGGDGYDLNKRINPFTTKRTNLVSIWSGILKADGAGIAKTTVDIPQFSGALRIMAVAYKDASFGSAHSTMRVADPIVISSGLPRFISPGDKVISPVTLTNTTTKSVSATIQCQTANSISVQAINKKNITIPANSEQNAEFVLVAGNEPGTATVRFIVTSNGETFTDKTELSVRPIGGFQKESGEGAVKAGESRAITVDGNYLGNTITSKLIVSRSPYIQFSDRITELLGYPHGCAEQTISKAFPQIYFADLAKSLHSHLPVTSDPMFNVQEAIGKIEALQTYDGGIMYWPGMEKENDWVSVYAAHFFKEAQKNGFQVNESVSKRLVQYLQYIVKDKQTFEYGMYDKSGKRIVKNYIPRFVPYALYVLALYGKQDIASMNYVKTNVQLLTTDGKYLLAATYKQLGDNSSFRLLLPNGFDQNIKSETEFGGTFGSFIRDYGIVLNCLVDTDPNHPQIPILSKQLSLELKNKKYLSTQESVFSLLAFGKLSRNQSALAEAVVFSSGKQIGKANGQDFVWNNRLADNNITINATGGTMYYFWQTEGISKQNTMKDEDRFIKVRKGFYDRGGSIINGNSFKQNDLVVVKLTLRCTNGQYIENVVLSDMLPAGFEIENPRVGAVPELSWIKDNAGFNHIDIRDDRIHFFTYASDTERNFYFLARAVTRGTFTMGAASADAMYNGDVYSYNGAKQITIN